jgi:hypothetical protein
MSVDFEDNNIVRRRKGESKFSLIELVKKTGIAKNDGQANTVLLVLALIFFAIAGYVTYTTFFPNLFDRAQPVPTFDDEFNEFGPGSDEFGLEPAIENDTAVEASNNVDGTADVETEGDVVAE